MENFRNIVKKTIFRRIQQILSQKLSKTNTLIGAALPVDIQRS